MSRFAAQNGGASTHKTGPLRLKLNWPMLKYEPSWLIHTHSNAQHSFTLSKGRAASVHLQRGHCYFNSRSSGSAQRPFSKRKWHADRCDRICEFAAGNVSWQTPHKNNNRCTTTRNPSLDADRLADRKPCQTVAKTPFALFLWIPRCPWGYTRMVTYFQKISDFSVTFQKWGWMEPSSVKGQTDSYFKTGRLPQCGAV